MWMSHDAGESHKGRSGFGTISGGRKNGTVGCSIVVSVWGAWVLRKSWVANVSSYPELPGYTHTNITSTTPDTSQQDIFPLGTLTTCKAFQTKSTQFTWSVGTWTQSLASQYLPCLTIMSSKNNQTKQPIKTIHKALCYPRTKLWIMYYTASDLDIQSTSTLRYTQ